MLAILDYKAGNQTSVKRALDHLGIPNAITNDPAVIGTARGLIFPGVGAAGQAMGELQATGLDHLIREMVQADKPLLGICVGCQILLSYSQENNTKALDIIPGECVLFNPAWTDETGSSIRVPHMGWNRVHLHAPCPLFEGIAPESEFYFVHSYYPDPKAEFVIGTTTYGQAFCSVHGAPGLWAVQFHPEKSGRPGLRLLKNFWEYCQEERRAV
ncbi:imidazole glycerol phosphate synthase subunit HisH [Megalodesulfovibrio gigas]|uniref:Imidazole glycerol phosphate synthase subunit HisH n=1 Tax=Megalodesulfovibrio gigas (strain ATCC 19364 / DSM 1382 / NCIMB 9332 / VKM B-1759) TaxID=1121448 RepID=T2GB58_MEGG1|nr:imidazole glycerol phosphate synthase subunit HisH [Megalodesulfovibrio gigas]AGW13366.1 putative imidazole glycerol phosphate synthase, glutamine amidotransferase subunit [Megalodesulfovibrio gigas DSM 1382 = ATCC 19364]